MLPRHAIHLGDRLGASPHAAHAHVLLVALDGDVHVEVGGRWLRAPAVLVAPDAVHRSASDGPSVAVLLDAEQARPRDPAPVGGAYAIDRPRLRGVVRALARELDRPPALAAAAPAIIAAAVGETAAVRVDPRIARALDRLRADGERVPLEVLARDAKLGTSHFSDLFAREVGLPLRSWQLWARVVRAAASPAPSLAARAADAGFADQAHMARSFRRFLGHPARAVLGARHALAR